MGLLWILINVLVVELQAFHSIIDKSYDHNESIQLMNKETIAIIIAFLVMPATYRRSFHCCL